MSLFGTCFSVIRYAVNSTHREWYASYRNDRHFLEEKSCRDSPRPSVYVYKFIEERRSLPSKSDLSRCLKVTLVTRSRHTGKYRSYVVFSAIFHISFA